jgi:glycosyltransferase involved in cell wall biosynthesis
MRISLFIPHLTIGGAEKAFVFLANELATLGHETTLVLLDDRGPLVGELSDAVRVVSLDASGVRAALPALVEHLRADGPDRLLSTLTHANLVAVKAARRAGVRVFVREATTISGDRRPLFSKARVVQLLTGRYYRRADGVIAVSEGVADDLRRNFGVPADKITVIYNPAYPRDLDRRVAEPPGHPWLEDPSHPTIVSVGRLTLAKDYPTLLRAFARVAAGGEDRLLILGDGELRAELEGLVRELGLEGRVDLPGFVANPFAAMARAALFVLSSQREGMPNVLIQAMACGCPVVATDCRSGPREVLEDGRHGPLVPVGDDEALARAIRERMAAPRDEAGLRARAARFSAERIGREYLAAMD